MNGATVLVTGGTVTVTGGAGTGTLGAGAGIGGGGGPLQLPGGDGGTVVVTGGTVQVTGGASQVDGEDDAGGGAGIGGGGGGTGASGGTAVAVTLDDGTVASTGGAAISSDPGGVVDGGPGAGIGGGGSGSGGGDAAGGAGIPLSAGQGAGDSAQLVVAPGQITGTPGANLTAAAGLGHGGGHGVVANPSAPLATFGAGTMTVAGPFSGGLAVASGATVDVAAGSTLSVMDLSLSGAGTVVNSGSILLGSGASLPGDGWGQNGQLLVTQNNFNLTYSVAAPATAPPDQRVYAPTVGAAGQSLAAQPVISGADSSGWESGSTVLSDDTSLASLAHNGIVALSGVYTPITTTPTSASSSQSLPTEPSTPAPDPTSDQTAPSLGAAPTTTRTAAGTATSPTPPTALRLTRVSLAPSRRQLTVRLALTAPGRLRMRVTSGRRTLANTTAEISSLSSRAGAQSPNLTFRLHLRPWLASRPGARGSVTLKLRLTFTPTSGRARTLTHLIRLAPKGN